MNSVIEGKLAPAVVALAQREAQSIFDEISGVNAVIVATADGFDVAAVVRGDLDPTHIAALASSIAAIGDVVSAEARLGRSRSVTVDTDDGLAVIFNVQRADISLVINVIASKDALIGQVNYRTAEASRRLQQ